jgi:uncharacterized Zn-finger protein
MGPAETIETDATIVACNGNGGALGHPRVFLNLAPHGRAECPYCSRLFVNPAIAPPGREDVTVAPPGVDTTIAPPRRSTPA